VRGIDAASVAAVEALSVSPGDHVLDLCAAPGAKFLLLAEHAALGTSGRMYVCIIYLVDFFCEQKEHVP
jgi:16S rRNA C967 or C1407 C5-methylase (RsmB/RsmF family)